MEVHHSDTQTNTVDHQLAINSQESRVLSTQTGNSSVSIPIADSGANHMATQRLIEREEAPKENQTISAEEFTEALKEMYHYGFQDLLEGDLDATDAVPMDGQNDDGNQDQNLQTLNSSRNDNYRNKKKGYENTNNQEPLEEYAYRQEKPMEGYSYSHSPQNQLTDELPHGNQNEGEENNCSTNQELRNNDSSINQVLPEENMSFYGTQVDHPYQWYTVTFDVNQPTTVSYQHNNTDLHAKCRIHTLGSKESQVSHVGEFYTNTVEQRGWVIKHSLINPIQEETGKYKMDTMHGHPATKIVDVTSGRTSEDLIISEEAMICDMSDLIEEQKMNASGSIPADVIKDNIEQEPTNGMQYHRNEGKNKDESPADGREFPEEAEERGNEEVVRAKFLGKLRDRRHLPAHKSYVGQEVRAGGRPKSKKQKSNNDKNKITQTKNPQKRKPSLTIEAIKNMKGSRVNLNHRFWKPITPYVHIRGIQYVKDNGQWHCFYCHRSRIHHDYNKKVYHTMEHVKTHSKLPICPECKKIQYETRDAAACTECVETFRMKRDELVQDERKGKSLIQHVYEDGQ
ncbi:hypothetical protein QAD02_021420 [Eretmocerus hayati]|uniref:Uncharacterized protein n=1 Tax=Eretmocerus hayati TaxID=131215 RepID=A0ACC2PQE6_9HYME|nr:hypothetical protein QAD02_021420 [Eretmocerus hayati]